MVKIRSCLITCTLLFGLFFGLILSAHAKFESLNDIEVNENGDLVIQTGDPYLVSNLDRQTSVNAKKRLLRVNISNFSPGPQSKQVDLEVFFKVADESKQTFFPNYRIDYQLDLSTTQGGELLLSIPDDIVLASQQLIRLDINSCSACVISISKPVVSLIQAEDRQNAGAKRPVKPSSFFNGALALEPNGHSIDSANWSYHHLEETSPSNVVISGNDPYFLSRTFLLKAENLAGVYFEVETTFNKPNFQLFYSSDINEFSPNASSIVETKTGDDSISRFFIPLRFLQQQSPVASVLKQIRLDIDIKGNENVADRPWSIKQAYIVPTSKEPDYAKYTPKRIIQYKVQKSGWKLLIKHTLMKIFSDPLFTLFYSLLILANMIFIFRVYRRASV